MGGLAGNWVDGEEVDDPDRKRYMDVGSERPGAEGDANGVVDLQ